MNSSKFKIGDVIGCVCCSRKGTITKIRKTYYTIDDNIGISFTNTYLIKSKSNRKSFIAYDPINKPEQMDT